AGSARDSIVAEVKRKLSEGVFGEEPEFNVYPPKDKIPEAYMRRRRELGYAMYRLMGIERKDRAKRFAAMAE
mgnify:CR=1